MSNIKRALPEDYSALKGDEIEPDLPTSQDELVIAFAVRDIDTGITTLEKQAVVLGVNPDEIRAFADRLVDIALKIEKPF